MINDWRNYIENNICKPIDKALNGNNQAEYQREYEPHHMQISHFENKESELISGSLGLLDFTS